MGLQWRAVTSVMLRSLRSSVGSCLDSVVLSGLDLRAPIANRGGFPILGAESRMDEQLERLPSCELATVQTSDPQNQFGAAPPLPEPAKERRHPRVKCFLAVQLRPADDQILRLGKLSDVSLGGCGVEAANMVNIGTNVALCPLATDGTLWIQGVVVNVRVAEFGAGYHIGVRFLEGDASAPTQNVQEFVRFVEETATRQDLQETYLGRLTRANS